MHCSNKSCGYTGEYLLRHSSETLQCPRCNEGELIRNVAQHFNIGGGNGKRYSSDVCVKAEKSVVPACKLTPKEIAVGHAEVIDITIRRRLPVFKN